MRFKNRRWRILFEVLLILALLAGVRTWQQRGLAAGEAPPLQGQLLSGEAVSLTALRGEPVLVYFWASWCPVCALTEEGIDAIAEDHRVLGVALQEDATTARNHLRAEGLDFPVLADPDGRLGAAFGVRGVPTLFVLDPAGRVRFTEVGYTSEWGLRLRLWWAGQ